MPTTESTEQAHPGRMVDFPANGRGASGYLALPPADGPNGATGPAVLVLQEWWGLVDHIKTVADRVAAAGFVALAPDLYHGEQAGSPDAAGKLMMALDIERVAIDLRGAATYLRGLDAVTPKRVGVVGFCMGGQLALFAAAQHPDVIDAAVDFYGIHPNVHPSLDQLRAPVLGHFGREDHSVPLERVESLFGDMKGRGIDAEYHVYEAGHAFANDTRAQVYNAAAADQAWQRTFAFFDAHLRDDAGRDMASATSARG